MEKKYGSIFASAARKMKNLSVIAGNTSQGTHVFAQTNRAASSHSIVSNPNFSRFSTNNASKEPIKSGNYGDENKRLSGAGMQLKEEEPIISEKAKRPLFAISPVVYYKKHIMEYPKKVKHIKPDLRQKRHFLLCKNCYWMASSLLPFSDVRLTKYKKCPNCISNIDKFPICDNSF